MAGQTETAFLRISGRQPGVDEPVVLRAIIERSDGAVVPGEWGDSIWPEVVIRGKAMGPHNVVEVPLGETSITVGKGPDYLPQTLVTNLTEAGRTYAFEFDLQPSLDLYSQGWRAGDAHIHFFHGDNQVVRSPEEAFRICAAGGLNFASFSGEHFGAGLLTRDEALRVWKPYEDSECQLWLGSEAPKATWGHHVAITYDPWAVQNFLPYSKGINSVHAQGGVSIPVHPQRTFPFRQEGDTHVLYPYNNYLKFLPMSALAGHLLDGWSAISDEPSGPGRLTTYHKLLQMGYRIPLLADSDFCMDRVNNSQKGLGFWLNYLHLDGQALSRAAVCEAIRRGRVLATTGPLVLFTMDGAMPGDSLPADGAERLLRIEASYQFNPWTLSYSNFAGTERCRIESVRLLRDGEIIREWAPNTPTVLLEEMIPGETERCNYMVQVLGNEGVWMAGYASPIYFERRPAARQPPVFQMHIRGRLYDAVNGQSLTGTVSCVRFGRTEWTMPTDENGLFRVWAPINAELVARDGQGRELSRNWLSHEPAYRFCSYLPELYPHGAAEAIDDFASLMHAVTWEFPIGLQSAASYIRTNLHSGGPFEEVEIVSAPDPLPGKDHSEIVMLLVDKTQAPPGETIHYAAVFRVPDGQTPGEKLQVQWGGWDPEHPRLYTPYGKLIAETRPWDELVDLGGGFYMHTNSVVVPAWVRNQGENGGILFCATVKEAEVTEDARLILQVGPTRNELLVSTTWDGVPAAWGARGIGPCKFNRQIGWSSRYPDYRGISARVRMNGENIFINPKIDTVHVADADDAIFEDHFYYDGQCEPEFRNIPFRDPIREQPPETGFSGVPGYAMPDRSAPTVALMEPLHGASLHSPVRLYFHISDAGLSGPGAANILLDGQVIASNVTTVPVLLSLERGDYTWQVEGADQRGNRALSEIRHFTVTDGPFPPLGLFLRDFQQTNGFFSFSFPSMEGLNYNIERATALRNWHTLLRTNASSNLTPVAVPLSESGAAFRVRLD